MEGKVYSSAIFSQRNEKTRIDFRNYDNIEPNRVCPFQIPMEIEKKIVEFMDYFKLKSCSLDIIVTNKNEYIFLEVNHVGQFDQVSRPCNYYIERDIVKYLQNMK